jgi:hypothetical protein
VGGSQVRGHSELHRETLSQNKKIKKNWVCSSLPSMYEALGSIPSTEKKKEFPNTGRVRR